MIILLGYISALATLFLFALFYAQRNDQRDRKLFEIIDLRTNRKDERPYLITIDTGRVFQLYSPGHIFLEFSNSLKYTKSKREKFIYLFFRHKIDPKFKIFQILS